jgi:putative membrane protein
MKSIVKFLIYSLSVVLTDWILEGIRLEDVWSAMVVAAILGLLNAFVKPILVLFSIPITLFTFGFFLLIINGFTVWLTHLIVPGFGVDSFGWAILFSIVLSLITWLNETLFGLNKKKSE